MIKYREAQQYGLYLLRKPDMIKYREAQQYGLYLLRKPDMIKYREAKQYGLYLLRKPDMMKYREAQQYGLYLQTGRNKFEDAFFSVASYTKCTTRNVNILLFRIMVIH